MSKEWFKKFITTVAADYVENALANDLISDWEIASLKKAVETGTVQSVNGLLILPDGRKWSLTTLNKEYLAHMAIYFELLESGLYEHKDIQLEYEHLDLMIFHNGLPAIGVEVKKSKPDAERMLKGMLAICEEPRLDQADRGNDPLRKCKCILKSKPKEFWVISPTQRWLFEVNYTGAGFQLISKVQCISA